MAGPVEMLQQVAHALGPLLDEVVFVGGTMPALLVTDPAAPPLRPTEDVDILVDSRSHVRHAVFEAKLRKRGFQIMSPPACRYGIGDVLVDVLTTSPEAMGFSEQWYAEAFATAGRTILPDGTVIRTIRAPLFLATKLNAWRDRGKGDYYDPPDLEDVLAVLDEGDQVPTPGRRSGMSTPVIFALIRQSSSPTARSGLTVGTLCFPNLK